MNNKPLCFVRANKTKFGGAEVYLSRLSNALQTQGIEHKILHSKFPKILPSWLRALLFNVQVCLLKGRRFYFSLDRITCPDVYRAGDGVHKVFLTTEKKSRLNPLHPTYLWLEKRCFQRAKCIIANSNMVKQQIVDTYHITPEKIRVIYNGVRSQKTTYQASFDRLSKEFSLDKDKPVFLYVGSGFKRKGVEEFIRILSRLNRSDIQAFVVGKEKNMQYYQDLVMELNLENQIVFTGPRDDAHDFYAISDIFILPTHYEPFSNVVLEAMSYGNAVFTTKQNGASEILKDEFIMETPKDLTVIQSINSLVEHSELLEQVKTDNRTLVGQFSIERNLVETYQVINEVIN